MDDKQIEVIETHLEIQFLSHHRGWTNLLVHYPDNVEEGKTWLDEWKAKDSVPKRLARVTVTTVMKELAA